MIKDKLDKLYDLKCGIEIQNMDKKAAIDNLLTPEIRAQIQEIENEFNEKIAEITDEYKTLESEIKDEIIKNKETVRGDYLMAVYTQGRTSWDTKSLDGYAVAHPEVAIFKKTGEPSVAIRVC